MKFAKFTVFATAIVALLMAGNAQAQPIPEAPESTRKAAALDILKKTPDAVLVYAQGLCCQSCGIGVRKKVGKLDFVDVFRFNTGVELHVQTQLATIAIKIYENPCFRPKCVADVARSTTDVENLNHAIARTGSTFANSICFSSLSCFVF